MYKEVIIYSGELTYNLLYTSGSINEVPSIEVDLGELTSLTGH